MSGKAGQLDIGLKKCPLDLVGCSVGKASALRLKGYGFNSIQSRALLWLQALVGARVGGNLWMCLSHGVFISPPPLSPSLTHSLKNHQ